MKKIFTILLLGLFLISFASALTSEFTKDIGDYGTYDISSFWPEWLGGGEKAEIKLIENTDQCLINCYAVLEGYFYGEEKLIDSIEFKDRKGNTIEDIKDLKFQYRQEEYRDIPTKQFKESCYILKNSTEICEQEFIGYKNVSKYYFEWKEYTGQKIDGYYQFKISASKIRSKDKLDWIVTILGEELIEWAWWDSSWDKKKKVTITEEAGATFTNYSVRLNVTYDANMEVDFKDLRFLDSTETTELDYWYEDIQNSTYAIVWVRILTLTASADHDIYMYYDNSLASSQSDIFNAFIYGNDGTLNDITDNFAGTCTGSIQTEKLKAIAGASASCKIDLPASYNSDKWKFEYSGQVTSGTAIMGLGLGDDGGSDYRDESTHNQFDISGNKISSWEGAGQSLWGYSDGNDFNYSININMDTLSTSDGVNMTYQNINGTMWETLDKGARDGGSFTTLDHMRFLGSDASLLAWDLRFRPLATTEPTSVFGIELTNQGLSTILLSPDDTFKTTESLINFSVNSTSIAFSQMDNVTLSVWYNNGTLAIENITALDSNTTVITNFSNTFIQGNYLWSAITRGGAPDGGTSNRSFEVHNTYPNVTIEYPDGLENYFKIGSNETLNYSISEAGQSPAHFTNCYYTYNSANVSLNCSENTTEFEYILGQNSIEVFAEDEFNLTGNDSSTWDYKLIEISQTYNNETIEGTLEDFLVNMTLQSGLSVTSTFLNYNGTQTVGESFVSGPNVILRKVDFVIPNVITEANVSFYWEVTLSDSSTFNLTSVQQLVKSINIDNCSSYTNEILNFTVLDEELQTLLPNATIEIAVSIYDRNRENEILNFSEIYNNLNPISVCIDTNITGTTEFSLDSITRYEEEDHANEYYNIVNLTLDSSSTVEKINLYDLNLNDSTEFQLSFTGSDFLPIENALVYVDRQYISENTFKTVELPKTDFNGQAVLHLVRNDIIYNLRILKNGEVLGNFENIVAFCDDFTIGDCNIELNAFDSVENIFNYNEDLDITFTSPEYNNNTRVVSFNFLTSDGTSKNVKLEVTRNDVFGNISICNSTVFSSGGTLSCIIPSGVEETTLKSSIYVEDVITSESSIILDSTNFGVGGYLVMFVMAISLILMFSGSKVGVLVALIVTFVGSVGMGIISGSIIGVGASGLWLLIIVIIGLYKLNKERVN